MLRTAPFMCFLRGPTPLWKNGNGRRKRNAHSLAFVITKTSDNFYDAFYKRSGKFSRPLKCSQMGLRCRRRHALKPTHSFMLPLKKTARNRNSGDAQQLSKRKCRLFCRPHTFTYRSFMIGSATFCLFFYIFP